MPGALPRVTVTVFAAGSSKPLSTRSLFGVFFCTALPRAAAGQALAAARGMTDPHTDAPADTDAPAAAAVDAGGTAAAARVPASAAASECAAALFYSTTVTAPNMAVYKLFRKSFTSEAVLGQRSCLWGSAQWDEGALTVWVEWREPTTYRNAQQYFCPALGRRREKCAV